MQRGCLKTQNQRKETGMGHVLTEAEFRVSHGKPRKPKDSRQPEAGRVREAFAPGATSEGVLPC